MQLLPCPGHAASKEKNMYTKKKVFIPKPGKGELIDQSTNICSSFGCNFYHTACDSLIHMLSKHGLQVSEVKITAGRLCHSSKILTLQWARMPVLESIWREHFTGFKPQRTHTCKRHQGKKQTKKNLLQTKKYFKRTHLPDFTTMPFEETSWANWQTLPRPYFTKKCKSQNGVLGFYSNEWHQRVKPRPTQTNKQKNTQ